MIVNKQQKQWLMEHETEFNKDEHSTIQKYVK